jgi:hypothetical protein
MTPTTTRRTSWLFDRLADLAAAERLAIHVDAAFADDLLHVLHRAAILPSTVVRFGPPASGDRDHDEARFVASDNTGSAGSFADLSDRDFGVSVGAHAPGASLKVDDIADVGSLLDALVTLRAHAQRETV